MAIYTKSYTHGGYTVVIVVTMRTGTNALGGGKFTNTNTVEITHYDGTVNTYANKLDEELDAFTTQLENDENTFIDAIPNVAVDAALITKGYVRT